jgi:DNA-binding MarR family transcriptional regulator
MPKTDWSFHFKILVMASGLGLAGVLSLKQFLLLLAMKERPGVTVPRLAKIAACPSKSVHSYTSQLRDLGLVRVERNAEGRPDGRTVLKFYLTDQGEKLLTPEK